MKQIDNRQNKLIQIKAETRPFPKEKHFPSAGPLEAQKGAAPRHGGGVLGLVSDLLLATKIALAAKHCHLAVHNFDKAGPLLEHAKEKTPLLILLDWDRSEAEAFKVLKELRSNADLKSVASIGYVSQSRGPLKEEAERAGCHRVYPKSEFVRNLEEIFVRYAS